MNEQEPHIIPVVAVGEAVGPTTQEKTRARRSWESRTTCCIPRKARQPAGLWPPGPSPPTTFT